MRPLQRGQARLPRLLAGRGQVFLEYAVSMVGVVIFVYVLLNVWTWSTGMLADRQQAFQDTRFAAGRSHPGKRVQYRASVLSLLGPLGSRGDPGDVPIIDDAPCPAARPLYERAAQLLREAQALEALRQEEFDQLQERSERLQRSVRAMQESCADNGQPCYDWWLDNVIRPIKEKIREHRDAIEAYSAQMQAKHDEAMQLMRDAQALCVGTPP